MCDQIAYNTTMYFKLFVYVPIRRETNAALWPSEFVWDCALNETTSLCTSQSPCISLRMNRLYCTIFQIFVDKHGRKYEEYNYFYNFGRNLI